MLKDEQILQLNSKEYDTLIRKAGTIREFDVNNSYGVRDYFWNYRKTFKNIITEQQYSKILKEVIQAMIDELKLDDFDEFLQHSIEVDESLLAELKDSENIILDEFFSDKKYAFALPLAAMLLVARFV